MSDPSANEPTEEQAREHRQLVLGHVERLIAALDSSDAGDDGIGAVSDWLSRARMRQVANESGLGILFSEESLNRLGARRAILRSLPPHVLIPSLDILLAGVHMPRTEAEAHLALATNLVDPQRVLGYARATTALIRGWFDTLEPEEITPDYLMLLLEFAQRLDGRTLSREIQFVIDLATELIEENPDFVDPLVRSFLVASDIIEGFRPSGPTYDDPEDVDDPEDLVVQFDEIALVHDVDSIETREVEPFLQDAVDDFLRATGMRDPAAEGDPWTLPANDFVSPSMHDLARELTSALEQRLASSRYAEPVRQLMFDMLNNVHIAARVVSPEWIPGNSPWNAVDDMYTQTQTAVACIDAMGALFAHLGLPPDLGFGIRESLQTLAATIAQSDDDPRSFAGHLPQDIFAATWRRSTSPNAMPNLAPAQAYYSAAEALRQLTQSVSVMAGPDALERAHDELVEGLMQTPYALYFNEAAADGFRAGLNFDGAARTLSLLTDRPLPIGATPLPDFLRDLSADNLIATADHADLRADRFAGTVLALAGYTSQTALTDEPLVPQGTPQVLAKAIGLLAARALEQDDLESLAQVETVASRVPREGNESTVAIGVLAALRLGHTERARTFASDPGVAAVVVQAHDRVAPSWRATVEPDFARSVVAERTLTVDVWDVAYDTRAQSGERLTSDALSVVGTSHQRHRQTREPSLPTDATQQRVYGAARDNVANVVSTARILASASDLAEFTRPDATEHPGDYFANPYMQFLDTLARADSPTVFLLSRASDDDQAAVAQVCRRRGVADEYRSRRGRVEVTREHIEHESPAASRAAGSLIDSLIENGRLDIGRDDGRDPAITDRPRRGGGPGQQAPRPARPRAIRRTDDPGRDDAAAQGDGPTTPPEEQGRRTPRSQQFGAEGRPGASRRIHHTGRDQPSPRLAPGPPPARRDPGPERPGR